MKMGKEFRHHFGLTQEDVAAAAHISRGAIAQVERGFKEGTEKTGEAFVQLVMAAYRPGPLMAGHVDRATYKLEKGSHLKTMKKRLLRMKRDIIRKKALLATIDEKYAWHLESVALIERYLAMETNTNTLLYKAVKSNYNRAQADLAALDADAKDFLQIEIQMLETGSAALEELVERMQTNMAG